jgi:hypothetical protein
MAGNEGEAVVQCGRRFSEEEIEQICETVELLPGLALTELTATICEHLGWHTAGGRPKAAACEKLLVKLEGRGVLVAPKKRGHRGWTRTVVLTERTDPGSPIEGTLTEVGEVRLEVVRREEKKLVNEYLQRYHPLGYRQPFGYRMRYFIDSDQGKLGCLLFGGAAKSLGGRDRWIGWTEEQRLQRLAWVVNLSRHLVFPWVQVRNLSSHMLGVLHRRIGEDWENRWGYRPVLLESFVDPQYHAGSSYKGAGWQELGMTSGEGLVRPGESYTSTPKRIFVRPLCGEFRSLLCSEVPPAERLQ